MSLERYDEAIVKRIQDVFPNVEFTDFDQTFEKHATEGKGREDVIVHLPLISVSRLNNDYVFQGFSTDRNTKRGYYSKEEEKRIKHFVVEITYQIDIWSLKRREVDAIWREVSMLFLQDQSIKVSLDGLKEPLDRYVRLLGTDNTTDVSKFTDKGRIHRQTINLIVEQADMIFASKDNLVKEIPIQTYVLTSEEELEDYIVTEDP